MASTNHDVGSKAISISSYDSEISLIYNHLQPLLLVSALVVRFRGLVENPESALMSTLLPLALSQFLYCVICLPPIGSSESTKLSRSGSRKQSLAGSKSTVSPRVSTRLSTGLLSSLLAFLAGTPLITVALILFGAPVTTHLGRTILCSAHLALLTAVPLVYVHGVAGSVWRKIGALMLPIDEVFGAAIGTMLGAWLGAIPIPLDWDRDWQKWPVTIVSGAYAGWVTGKLVGRYIFFGKTINLTVR